LYFFIPDLKVGAIEIVLLKEWNTNHMLAHFLVQSIARCFNSGIGIDKYSLGFSRIMYDLFKEDK
jgi:hypothetical protein